MNEPFVLGVDLDGVCGDYTAAFRQVVAQELGVDPETLQDARDWTFSSWGLDEPTFDRLHRAAVLEHRMFRWMPALPGVAETLWHLSDLGVWIRLITHRLYVSWGHATAVGDTVHWLDEVGIPYRDLCFLGRKPEVEADAYLEDAPHNVEALRAAGNLVIVFDQPYNQGLGDPRVRDWAEAGALVEDLLAAHGPVQQVLTRLEYPEERIPRSGAATSQQGTLPAEGRLAAPRPPDRAP